MDSWDAAAMDLQWRLHRKVQAPGAPALQDWKTPTTGHQKRRWMNPPTALPTKFRHRTTSAGMDQPGRASWTWLRSSPESSNTLHQHKTHTDRRGEKVR